MHKYILILLVSQLSTAHYAFSQTNLPLGDVNRDGYGDILDIVQIIEIITGVNPMPGDYEYWFSDVNQDHTVDVSDIVLFVNVILDETDYCPEGYEICDEWDSQCCYESTGDDFSWMMEILANGGGSSVMFDAAILNENDIWAVGYFARSEHGDPENYDYYNAAHWNGEDWEYIAVPVHIIGDNGDILGYCSCAIYCIEAFGPDEIWFLTNVNGVIHWDGSQYTYYSLGVIWNENLTNSNYGGWGTGPDNLYMASYLGNVFHFDGTTFEHIGDLPIPLIVTKITGSQGEVYMLGKGNSGEYSDHSMIVKVEDNELEVLIHSQSWVPNEENPLGYINAIWSFGGDLYLISHGGFYKYDNESSSVIQLMDTDELGIYPMGVFDMDGNNPFDIVAVGFQGRIFHFDGSSWDQNHYLADNYNFYFGEITKFDIKDDIIVFLGKQLSGLGSALVLVGYRD